MFRPSQKKLAIIIAALASAPVLAQETSQEELSWWQKIPGLSPQVESAGDHSDSYTNRPLGSNTETTLIPAAGQLWVQDAESFISPEEAVLENDVLPPLLYREVEDELPAELIAQLEEKLAALENAHELQLIFTGHTDTSPLREEQQAEFADKNAFALARAQRVAEYFQTALELSDDAIVVEARGDSEPLTENITVQGRELNRRVDLTLRYFELDQQARDAQRRAEALQLNRVQVCRQEAVCKLRYSDGSDQRARLKNLVSPLRLQPGQVDLPAGFVRRIHEVRSTLLDKPNLTIHFVGHTNAASFPEGPAELYDDQMALSRAEARRVALAVADQLNLPGYMVTSSGKGATQPVAANDTAKGRSLNHRVEVEFWYDDLLETAADGVQACPESATAETITIAHESATGDVPPIFLNSGDPQISSAQLAQMQRLMDEVAGKSNVRLSFVGYSDNQRMERREAMVYGDDVGLSSARAQKTMRAVQERLGLEDSQIEFHGRGYVESKDVVQTGFIHMDGARVEVQVLYDELAILAEQDRLEIERLQQEAVAHNPYALNLMRITVDGAPEYDPHKNSADLQRCTDVALEQANIQFRFDNQTMQPRLNVTAFPSTIRYADDPETELVESRVSFKQYMNYPAFVTRGEVRIFEAEQSLRDAPLAVVTLDQNGEGEWDADFESFQAPLKKLKYVLRVYDWKQRFDETRPQTLWLVDNFEPQLQQNTTANELLVGYGENRLAEQNIPVSGNAVLVNGAEIPTNHSVWLAGREVPVSNDGTFVAEEIFAKGLHTVEVAVLDDHGNGELFLRDLEFNRDDWFTVGIADVTIAHDDTNGPAALVTGDETHYDNSASYDGRLAFYTSGSFGDGWRLSASADTEEGPIDELFSNFMEKTPDALFRRLDSDLYYPTFGDDSTVVEDAPTSGKFYIKLENYDDYGLWGNFKASYTDNELAHIDRALYGANLHFETDDLTDFGDKRFEVDAFSAEPGTIAGRDEFRGTGGSLYYLRHQDILTGSERLRVEVRDKNSGLVLGVKNLTPVIDYDVDYIQGRVVLNRPLSAIAGDNLIIQDGSYNGNPQYLVARYEYTPGFDDLDTLAVGGRAHYWAGDHVRIGVTASQQDEEDNESSLNGIDLTLRKTSGTWIKLETAESQGNALESLSSLDGGYSFSQERLGDSTDSIDPIDPNAKAGASKVEAAMQLDDFFSGARGSVSVYAQQRDAGFSAPGQLVARETEQYGGAINVPIGERFDVALKADSKEQQQGLQTGATDVELGYRLDDHWRLAAAARSDSREDLSPVVPLTQKQGDRTDVAIQAGYDSGANWSAFGFVQRTAELSGSREENNRIGFGGAYRVSDRFTVDSELSGGDTGTAASVGTDFLVTDRTNLYLNYTLDNERTDTGVRARKGNLNSGFRSRFSDTTSIYGEERYTHGDVSTGLTHALGVDLAPSDKWSYGTNLEAGTLEDPRTGAETERRAMGASVGFNDDALRWSTAVEYRVDNIQTLTVSTVDIVEPPSEITAGEPVDQPVEQVVEQSVLENERKTWLLKNALSYQLSADWRLVGKLNYSDSESSAGQFYDGKFTEGVMGYAYRPVDNDRWNTLLKYTYFYNVPTSDQVLVTSSSRNSAIDYVQKSHIFSVDTNYDLTRRWTLGAKYAYRLGQLSMERENPEFFDSTAHLYVLRADWHFVNQWDLLIEGRMLDLPEAGDRRSGALLALYRQMGRNFKAGVGYNFTDFSDDLTDLDYDSQGVFINMVGKF
ncbi:flagellar motor protein MotB [Microbulbifer agarilyticus]|uniref:Flagellar motor protein MotB n=1 Tax=Microbulbifer agarilyticus TaxID=260552 RepID=A0A1Q2M2J2_9GAMM|nr:OmpA family protein [Microbulbifer agarilyticus]AQQ66890.1 flagellar motor protein MotB [Microbulbifer agarilyticus]